MTRAEEFLFVRLLCNMLTSGASSVPSASQPSNWKDDKLVIKWKKFKLTGAKNINDLVPS